MNRDMILGLVRHVLTFGGGYFVAKGYTDTATAETLISALVALGGAVWSVVDKKSR